MLIFSSQNGQNTHQNIDWLYLSALVLESENDGVQMWKIIICHVDVVW